VIIDPSGLDPQNFYKLLIGSVVPRPIAWIYTVSREGVRNLAPFNFFTVASRKRSSRKPVSATTLHNTRLLQPPTASLLVAWDV
jgi:hypothetical protein